MKNKETFFKNIVFLLFFIVIFAYIHNMLRYFLYIYEDMPEMVKPVFFYTLVFALLISALAILNSIIVFKVSINYTLLSAWIYGTFSLTIVSQPSSPYREIQFRILTICIINLLASVLLYFSLRNKRAKNE